MGRENVDKNMLQREKRTDRHFYKGRREVLTRTTLQKEQTAQCYIGRREQTCQETCYSGRRTELKRKLEGGENRLDKNNDTEAGENRFNKSNATEG